MTLHLSVGHITRLAEIFAQKNWGIEDDVDKFYKTAFNRLCTLISELPNDEIELILTLTKNYKCYDFGHYYKLLVKAISGIDINFLHRFENIYITQLVTPDDIARGDVKSASQLLYPARETLWNITRNSNIYALDNVDSLSKHHRPRRNSLIIFVDDYIGSSGTAIKAYSYYLEKHLGHDDETILLALAAQQEGISCLNELGVNTTCGVILNKGIADNNEIRDKPAAYTAMNSIEKNLKIQDEYLRGYYSSEGLVSMVRTPNNTFPLFWHSKGRHGKIWPAPFERSKRG